MGAINNKKVINTVDMPTLINPLTIDLEKTQDKMKNTEMITPIARGLNSNIIYALTD